MKESKKRVIVNALIIIQVVLILTISVSYAWFANKASPTIGEDNIKVSSAEGLVIKLNPDSAGRSNIDLNQLFSDWSSFELNQVSSFNGRDFFTIDFGAGLSYNLPTYVAIEPDQITGTINMERYGCIDYNFYFATETFAKHVYFHKDSFIRGNAANSIRVAVTTTSGNVETTKIFGIVKENGTASFPYTTNAVMQSGTFDYGQPSNARTTNQDVFLFSDYNGGRGNSDEDIIDVSKMLFTMEPYQTLKVNIKIWLEGGDEDCDNDLANTTLDVLLKFGSANVLRDAPNVYANNTYKTITNLTTEMEYAYDNTNDTTWLPVEDPSMEFTSGTMVYVRYKEVQGVSPHSYVTPVAFI